MNPLLRLTAASLAFTALASVPAGALPLTVSFTGRLELIDPQFSSLFTVGQAGSGSFQIESTTPDDLPLSGSGLYHSPVNFSFQFGGYTATAAGGTPQDFVRIDNSSIDLYTAEASSNVSGATLIGLFVPTLLGLVLNDGNATAFSSEALPTQLHLADFSNFAVASIRFEIPGTGGGSIADLALTLTSITVPEPSALLLLAFSCLASGVFRERRTGFSARLR